MLPPELVNHIFSYLPIVSEEEKIIHTMIKHYKTYFLKHLTLRRNYDAFYNCWLNLNKPIKTFLETNDFTLLHIRQLYRFSIQYGHLI